MQSQLDLRNSVEILAREFRVWRQSQHFPLRGAVLKIGSSCRHVGVHDACTMSGFASCEVVQIILVIHAMTRTAMLKQAVCAPA